MAKLSPKIAGLLLMTEAMSKQNDTLLYSALPDNDITYDPDIIIQPLHRNKPTILKHKKKVENKSRAIQARISKTWKKRSAK